jgi:hypothetical protein
MSKFGEIDALAACAKKSGTAYSVPRRAQDIGTTYPFDAAWLPRFLSSRLPLLAESPWKRQSCYVQHHRPMHPVEKYLQEIQQIHSTGAAVPETSYYSALSELLNAVGARLKPKVRCIAQLKNKGAGSPDFGLYTSPQFQTSKDREPLPGQKPERGVVEVKPVKDDSWLTAESKQVSKLLTASFWASMDRPRFNLDRTVPIGQSSTRAASS